MMMVNVVYEVYVCSMPPIDEHYFPLFVRLVIVGDVATVERDGVSGVELLLFDETVPTFSHHVALATVPIGVTKPPRLAVSVLEIQRRAVLIVF